MVLKEKWQQRREAASLVAVVTGLVTEPLSVFRIPVQSGNLKQWANKGKLRAI